MKMNKSIDYIEKYKDKLKNSGFQLFDDLTLYKESIHINSVALYNLKDNGTGISNTICVTFCDNCNPSKIIYDEIYDYTLKFAKTKYKEPFYKKLYSGSAYTIIQCIISENASESVKEYVSSRPRKHFGRTEFPVLFDIKDDKPYFYEGKFIWGSLFLPYIRVILNSLFDKCY